MNILVPDLWLREFLKTNATPDEIKTNLSLCGPSVERIYGEGGELVYDIEVTTNRPDSMSIFGIAREANVILPQFGIPATLVNNPYLLPQKEMTEMLTPHNTTRSIAITTDETLNPRFTALVIDNIHIGPSPDWLRHYLELSGIRSINTVVDVTNYLMRAFGQPAHAFDYNKIAPNNKGVPVMKLRASKKGEKLTTLDGKTHILLGDDIVIEDGSKTLIDMCGIMGGSSSHITDDTKTVILFLQTYDPAHIRRTSMSLAHRTEAAALFEKGPDSEMVLPAIALGTKLLCDLTNGTMVSPLYDIYPKPYVPCTVSVTKEKVDTYLGTKFDDNKITNILNALGFTTTINATSVSVTVPSFRRDVTIDVDIIEEIARIWGYHTVAVKLPETAPPMTIPEPILFWEQEIKKRLRDVGLTEIFSYSMVSDEMLTMSGVDTHDVYRIANPLSNDWVYLRPTLVMSMLGVIKPNISYDTNLSLFELSNIYKYRQNDLPLEKPMLCLAATGDQFRHIKGIVEMIFDLLGIPFPSNIHEDGVPVFIDSQRVCMLGAYGYIGYIAKDIRNTLSISPDVVIAHLDFGLLIHDAKPTKTYTPIPKYPSATENYALIVRPNTHIGIVLARIKTIHPMITNVELIDSHEQIRTVRVTFQDPNKNLSSDDIRPLRGAILTTLEKEFGAVLKTS